MLFSHIYQFMLLCWLFCNHSIWSDKRLWSTDCRLFWFCLSCCLTSLHPPLPSLLDDLLAAGLKWQIHVVRPVTVHVQANQHHWVTVRSCVLSEWTRRELCRHCTSNKPSSGYPVLLVSFLPCTCNSRIISSPLLPILKSWKCGLRC